jgi:Zn-dependent protease with chaperone function
MTRRGSLVYYLASWIIGGFFLTIMMYLQERASPGGLGIGPTGAGAAILTTYFLTLVFCAFLSVVFAYLLRLTMGWFDAEKLWQWVLAGVVLSLPMTWGVRWGSRVTDAAGIEGAPRQIAVFLFLGVRGIAEHHPFLGLPAAGLTAAVLFLIHRAFSEKASGPDSQPPS